MTGFSRRSVLKVAAAVPAVAAISATPAAVCESAAAPKVAPVVASERPYRWWFTTDVGGEFFTDLCDSKEQALARLDDHGYGIVAECQDGDFDLHVDADAMYDLFYGQNEDKMDEDGEFLSFTADQERDLADMVNAAIDAWIEKHGIDTKAPIFRDVREYAKKASPPRKALPDGMELD